MISISLVFVMIKFYDFKAYLSSYQVDLKYIHQKILISCVLDKRAIQK